MLRSAAYKVHATRKTTLDQIKIKDLVSTRALRVIIKGFCAGMQVIHRFACCFGAKVIQGC